MYNLMNSPGGPLGQAGQSNASTQPAGLFANAPASFNNFGKGIESFTSGLKGKLGGLMDKLFPGLGGGDGNGLSGIVPGLASIPGAVGQIPQNVQNGVASIFGGGPGSQGPSYTESNPSQSLDGILSAARNQATGGGGSTNPNHGVPQAGGGFLSRFMGGAQ